MVPRPDVLKPGTSIHLVGVAGSGMSGIAEVLNGIGCVVTGSDLRRSRVTERLRSLGVRCDVGHDAGRVEGADAVVVSAAVPPDDPERREALRRGIPVLRRGEMLAALAGSKRAVAVAGAHGKTTTAAMIAVALEAGGLDPTAIIGGTVSMFGGNARVGQGPVMVVEADESDRSFLELAPEVAVVTNLDEEHLDAYGGMERLEDAFVQFAARAAGGGCVVACADDRRLSCLLPRIGGDVVTYGVDDPSAQLFARDVACGPAGSRSRVRTASGAAAEVDLELAVPGRHNVQNALAALAVGLRLDVAPETSAAALTRFRGVDRRLQVCGEVDGVVVVDDYGHHPTEIEAVLAAVRLRAPGRVRVVFQPHRYSRTIRLLDRFGAALAAADEVLLTDVYAAGEAAVPGATAEAVAGAVRRHSGTPVHVVRALDDLPERIAAGSRAGDVVVTLGAGSIAAVPQRIVEALQRGAGRDAR